MCGVTVNFTCEQIKLLRKYLKLKVLEDNVTFRGHSSEREHVFDLLKRTVVTGESHSALMIGPRGSGKTTLINSAFSQLAREVDLDNDAIIIKLNGLIHHDDKLALKSITAQMQLENAVGDRVFGTFAENLAFLLSCLQSGVDRRCKSMVFILEEFDAFCYSGRTQTLLYNLFDITHSEQAPMCVIGITNRIDVMELLEKRVKSRFSHRHIFLFPLEDTNTNEILSPLNHYKDLFKQLLTVPTDVATGKIQKKKRNRSKSVSVDIENSLPSEVLNRCKMDPKCFSHLDQSFLEDWNCHINSLIENELLTNHMEKFTYFTVNEQIFRNVLFQVICKLSPQKPFIDIDNVISTIDKTVTPEHRIKMLQSLSILELSLVIAMMHGMDIFDGQPMNFEMVLHRYTKFSNANSSTQSVPRPVILKAFEHLQSLEIIMPVRNEGFSDTTTSKVQKEYKLYTLAVPVEDIREAVKSFKALPTEISHWFNNSIV